MLPENDDIFLSRWLEGSLSAAELEVFEHTDDGRQFRELIGITAMLKPGPYMAVEAYATLKAIVSSTARTNAA